MLIVLFLIAGSLSWPSRREGGVSPITTGGIRGSSRHPSSACLGPWKAWSRLLCPLFFPVPSSFTPVSWGIAFFGRRLGSLPWKPHKTHFLQQCLERCFSRGLFNGGEKTLTQGYPSVKQERASFSASGVLVCSGTVVGATERRDYLPLRFSLPIPGRLFSERVGKALIFPLPG